MDTERRSAAGGSLPGATAPVDVHGERVRVRETLPDVGVEEAHRRFGGLDVPASLVGMLAALALTVLLAGLTAAAVGAVGYQTGLEEDAEEVSLAALLGGIAILFVSFVVGGWTAARIARYDGGRNGVAVAAWAILLAAVIAALAASLGDEYDVFGNVGLPQWFSDEALTAAAIVSGAAAALSMLIGGIVGGLWGERYHRRADAAIASARPGGMGR